MAKLNILWDIPTDRGTWSGGDWVATLPLDNLITQDITEVARTTSADPAATRLTVALPRLLPVSAIAWVNHNAPSGSTYRLRAGIGPDPEEATYDAPGLPFWEPTVVWGSLPWGAFPWDGIRPDDYPGTPIAYHRAPEAQFVDHLFVDVTLPGDASYFQAGRLLAGEAFVPNINHQYGGQVGIVDPSTVRRTTGGRRIVGKLPKYRRWQITLAYQAEGEAFGVYWDLMYRLGKSGEMLILWDPDLPAATRARLTLYCALSDTTDMTVQQAFGRDGRPMWSVTFDVEEMI